MRLGSLCRLALCTSASLLAAGTAAAQSVGLSELNTKDVEILYYDPIQTYLTPYVGRAYENSFAFQRKIFDWKPWDRPALVLRDLDDYGNATVHETPSNVIILDVAPFPTTFETFSPGERFFTVMNHELVHVATTDVWNEQDAWWRRFLHGKPNPITEHPESLLYNYLSAPRTNGPRWYFEGSAVFLETWMGGGRGRAQGGYDEMVFRAKVRDDAKFYTPLGLEAEGNSVDFQVGVNDYLYGTRFDSYLAYTYGPEKVIEWLKREKGSDRYYETDFARVFGKPLDDAWQDWIGWEHDFQTANLKSVRQYPLTPTRKLTDHALGSVSRTFYDPATDSLIAGFRAPGVLANIGMISLTDGRIRKLTNIKGPSLYRVTSIAYDAADKKIYYTTDNNAYRDLMEIDLPDGAPKMLIRDGRTGDLALNPADRSLWGIRSINGLNSLVRVGAEHDGWKLIHAFPYGRILFDLDISPDGQYLSASVGEINGDQRIAVYRIADLQNGVLNEVATMKRDPAVPEGGVFSRDGKYLYATAFYTGVSNVYRLELATGKIEAVSNAETGFFRPLPMADGSLIVYEYTGQGFAPVRIDPKPLDDLGNVSFLGTEIAGKYPVVKTWAVGPPSQVPLDSMITSRGEYIPRDELQLMSLYPTVMGYRGHGALGLYADLEDPLGYNQLTVNVSGSPAGNITTGEQFHADVSYRTLYWHLRYWHNDANFYDLFGPVDRSRKGDALLGGYSEALIYDPPRRLDFSADLELYSGLNTLPGAQNVAANDPSLATVRLAINYDDIDKSLGAVDYEEGYHLRGEASSDYAHGTFFPKARLDANAGFALPWQHSSLWAYTSAGYGTGNPHDGLDYFYFGSFGNNYVDDGEVKRYRNYDSFPGFDIDAISAQSFVKAVGEWNLPPVRFSDVGTAGFFLSSVRPALFAGVLVGDPGRTAAHSYESVGFQLDWNFTIAVRLPMTFSIGYARGFSDSSITSRHDEILASLKIL
ncbi:MAG TPA: hypothetical protein VGB91_09045 [Rhizomicrobium sp.]